MLISRTYQRSTVSFCCSFFYLFFYSFWWMHHEFDFRIIQRIFPWLMDETFFIFLCGWSKLSMQNFHLRVKLWSLDVVIPLFLVDDSINERLWQTNEPPKMIANYMAGKNLWRKYKSRSMFINFNCFSFNFFFFHIVSSSMS